MGDGAQTAIEEISDLEGRTGESDEKMAEGRSDIFHQQDDVSGVRQRAMRDSVMMGLIIARVIQSYSSQSLTASVSSGTDLVGDVPDISRVLEEGSGSGRLSLMGTNEGQSSAVQESLISPFEDDYVQLPTESIGDLSNTRGLVETKSESDVASAIVAYGTRKKAVEELPNSLVERQLQSIPERGESSTSSQERALESVRLVTCWFSPFAHRVAISLRVKGVHHVSIEEKALNKNERTLNANPLNKKVPILIHKGRIISESRIIMEYVDEAWPGDSCSLLPKDPYERSAARYWSDYIDKRISDIILRHIGVNGKDVYDAVNEALICLNKAMTLIPHGKSFFLGDRLGFVDISFAPMIPWFQALQKLDKYKFPDAQKCPRLHEWLRALQKHPSVKPSLEASSPRKLRALIMKRYR